MRRAGRVTQDGSDLPRLGRVRKIRSSRMLTEAGLSATILYAQRTTNTLTSSPTWAQRSVPTEWPSSRDDGGVVIWRPGLLERSDRDLLIPATEDATVVEVHYPCSGVYPGDDDEVVRDVSAARPVPDGFGVDYHDDPASFGQIMLQLVNACLNIVGLDSVLREQHWQILDIGVRGEVPDRAAPHSTRRALGQRGDALFGGLVSGDLADHVSHRHLPAVGSVLLAPVLRGGDGVAVHPDIGVDGTGRGGVDDAGRSDQRGGGAHQHENHDFGAARSRAEPTYESPRSRHRRCTWHIQRGFG